MMRSLLISLLALLVVGVPAQAASLSSTGSFLASSLDANGCARESGAAASVNLTSWATLGLVASGRSASSAASCIERHSKALTSTTDIELAVLALAAARRRLLAPTCACRLACAPACSRLLASACDCRLS
ncbi:MAG: hypothetical protein NTZ81_05995, partial [Actinobacteria bacterium]|nr:hypothetical protein [Actinomycetota bacterium]